MSRASRSLLFALLAAACASGGRVIGPPVGSGTLVDEFDRVALGADWRVQSRGAAVIRTGDVSSASARLMIATFVGRRFPADQFSEVTSSAAFTNTGVRGIQIFVRRNEATRQRYGFFLDNATNRYHLKVDGGSPGVDLVDAPAPALLQPNDVIRIEVSGDLLRGLVNGVEVLSVRDARLTGGQPGFVVNPTAVVPRVVGSWRGGGVP